MRLLLVLVTLGLAGCASYYQGPPSDHFDGRRFHNPEPRIERPPFAFLRWLLTRDPGAWPEHVPLAQADRPPRRVEGGMLRVSFVNHATLLLQTRGLNILTDPVWSERASPVSWAGPRRVQPPGIAFDDLPPIDVVLVSHNHYDHLDLATLARLQARDAPRVLVPLGNDAILARHDPPIAADALDWGDRVALSRSVAVTAAPMRHWSARGPFDRNAALWAAFAISTPEGTIYFVGDSGYDAAMFREARQAFAPIRLALLPIGAYEPRWFMRPVHMTPAEAVQAHRDLAAPRSLGIHQGTFRLADEAYDAPRQALARARQAAGVPAACFPAPANGEVFTLPATAALASPCKVPAAQSSQRSSQSPP
ncbi:MBL fold metallo-hydrolase [Spiribacter halobius]|uniref:Metallo-beta-lactamase domain-containing protein n=1 Tax=Sediminicurvatus halobius TaxID=2182432 RepID=A0A2U2MZ83_9GAMM|nr:MBL fold metallo-hydrolase [Spiribacter halobius]PWG62034.1 hypothetical protein DEM34_13695 [Spiribacter halobius]UEX78706.1 MBL fold metallo-hydrolase [Spiribacter halobius]